MNATFIGINFQSKYFNYEQIIGARIEYLIFQKKVFNFIFGEYNYFTQFCWNIVNQYKYRYGVKKTYYVKDSSYEQNDWERLKLYFDDRYTPISFQDITRDYNDERWYEMINDSEYVVFYNDGENELINKLWEYAVKKEKVVYNLYKELN